MTPIDVLRATFPAGTLSGAPKIRAMEIIDELEPVKRGVYGGAVGYLGWHGAMDTAIAIRTSVIKNGRLHIQAGAGIVADSVPSSEWQETMNKGRATFRAVSMATEGLDREQFVSPLAEKD
jgi:anthranilate synthase component 1